LGLNSKQLERSNEHSRQTSFKAICGKVIGKHTNKSIPIQLSREPNNTKL